MAWTVPLGGLQSSDPAPHTPPPDRGPLGAQNARKPMLIPLLLASLAPSAAPATAPLGGGKVAWFEGSYADALAKAKAEKKLIFIDFWTDWCGWCKRLDADTFSQQEVGDVLKDLVCLSIDAESESGAVVAKGFVLQGFPALMIVNGDGVVQDSIGGYLPPDGFVKEIERVQRGEGTVGGLETRIAADPQDLDARFELAQKLETLGDPGAAKVQLDAIKAADPEGRSQAMRTIQLFDAVQAMAQAYGRTQELDTAPVVAFLSAEKHPSVATRGWMILANIHGQLEQPAEATHAFQSAWKHCPADERADVGPTIANALLSMAGSLTDADKALALAAAEGTRDKGANQAELYARCLHLNGKVAEALSALEGAVELYPDNAKLQKRLKDFRTDV